MSVVFFFWKGERLGEMDFLVGSSLLADGYMKGEMEKQGSFRWRGKRIFVSSVSTDWWNEVEWRIDREQFRQGSNEKAGGGV